MGECSPGSSSKIARCRQTERLPISFVRASSALRLCTYSYLLTCTYTRGGGQCSWARQRHNRLIIWK